VPKETIVAQGDWTKNLVQLAKTAELKKHALTLQLHTAHILSAHASMEQKKQGIQDVKEQKNKLESERMRLLKSLQEVNEDRDKADMMEVKLEKECTELRNKIQVITDGEYALAKREVDQLHLELGKEPVPNLQSVIEEKSAQYLQERLAAQNAPKRPGEEVIFTIDGAAGPSPAKRPRGRPRGSKNRKNDAPSMTGM